MTQRGIQTDDRERVKAASDIAEVIREHLALTPKGREFVALCPFHDDHRPSMYVVPAKQIYHCFSCGATGDVFTFVMKYLGLEFPEAMRMLAERARIELTTRPAAARAPSDGPTIEQIRQTLALAGDFYRAALTSSDHGRAAREMVRARGIDDATAERFGLGAAPDDWERLVRALRSKGIPDDAMVAAGVARRRDSGGCFDTIRNRLVFPIHAAHGKIAAFGGRKLNPDDEPKYLNTPETTVFRKGSLLYGLSQAMPAVIRTGRVVIVEGYIDVIACHQHGLTNVVGTMGTALTPDHARGLRGRAREVVLLFDSDEAGARAAFRAGEVFFGEPLDVRVAAPPPPGFEPKDPDELLAESGGRAALESMISSARDVVELRFHALRERVAGAGPAAMASALEQELARLVEIGINEAPPVRRRLILRQIASVLGMLESDVARLLPAGRSAQRRQSAAATSPDQADYRPSDPPSTQEVLLGCALACPDAVDETSRDLLRPEAYSHPLLAKVAQGVQTVLARGGSPGLEFVLRALGPDEPARQAAMAIAHHIEHIHGHGTDDQRARLHDAWREATRRARLSSSRGAISEIKPAHIDDDAALMAAMERSLRRKRELGPDPGALPRPYDG